MTKFTAAFVLLLVALLALGSSAEVDRSMEWSYSDSYDYIFASSDNGLYGVIGFDNWYGESSHGKTDQGLTPHAYICKPGQTVAIPLVIPKYKGTNMGYKYFIRVLFVHNNKWLVATTYHPKTGKELIIGWSVTTKEPKILAAYNQKKPMPKLKGIAAEYWTKRLKTEHEDYLDPKLNVIGPNYLQIGNCEWSR